jgi:hypothetical protein
MGKLDAVGFGLDGVGEATHLVQRRVILVTLLLFPCLRRLGR